MSGREHSINALVGLIAGFVLFAVGLLAVSVYQEYREIQRAQQVTQAIEPIVKPLIKEK